MPISKVLPYLAALVTASAGLLAGACGDPPTSRGVAVTASASSIPATPAATASATSSDDAGPPATTDPSDAGVGDGGASDGGVSDAGVEEKRPCPEGMALVQRFCIDKYEADILAKSEDGTWSPLPANREPIADGTYRARSVPNVMPQGYINRNEATLACKNAGKRLCTMNEWRRACEGRPASHWPYGRKLVAGKCNHQKPHLLSMKFGADSRRWTYEMFNDPSLDVEPGFLARTGEFDGCTTSEGVYDLVGNLHEWVSDTVDSSLVDKLEAEDLDRHSQPWREGNGVFMGGFFSTADQHGPGCTFTTIAHEPAYHDYSIGFRCCAAADLPPPARKPESPRKKRRATPKE